MIISTSVAVILLHLTILSAAQDPADCTEGEVEFVGLSVDYAGIVRVCHNGVWGTICADEFTPWSEKNCQVACRSAGYSGAVSPILQETINAVIRETVTDDPIHYRSVGCDGSESSITQCPSSDITGSCIHNYDAAVTCRSSSATAGDVRLLGDSRDGMGAVEYYDTFLGWTGVCVDSTYSAAWLENSAAARIVCSQLGYEGGDPYIQTGVSTTALPRRSAGFLTCTEGTDFNLGSCRRTTAVCDASTISAGGVMCTKTVAEDGSVRLVGGNDRAGVVEVAYNGRWGTLCEDDSWDAVDATVVCSQLGLSDGDPVTLSGSYPDYHRTSAKPSWLSAVECASTETGLSECPHSLPIGYTTCTVSNSAELSCGSAPVDEGGLSGGAVAGIVIGSLIGLSVIGWLIYIFDKDKKRKQAAATVTRPHPPAPAPAQRETRHASGTVPATTVSHIQQQQQEPPSQPTTDFTVAAPPTYQVAVAYPTATPQAPPTYTDKTGAYPAPSPAYPPPTPSAPPAAGLSFGDYPPYPDQAYNPAFPPPAAPAQPDFPQLFR